MTRAPVARRRGKTPDFILRSYVGLSACALLLLLPFALNNFVQGRLLLGAGALAVIAIVVFNAASLLLRGRYYPLLTLLGLGPALVFFLVLSIRRQGAVGVLWCYPALMAFYFMLPERKAWLANVALLGTVLPAAWGAIPHPLALRMAATLGMLSVFSAIFLRIINEQQQRLEAQAVTDPLTGLYNRTLLPGFLDDAIRRHRRSGQPMALATVDLDHFKAVNDSRGHDAGDAVLRGVGELLRARARRTDRVVRLGGEEFLVLLHDTGAEGARRLAEDLRAAVAAAPLLDGRPVTASIGLATLRPGDDADAWMKRSDQRLYLAKQQGRDRVVG